MATAHMSSQYNLVTAKQSTHSNLTNDLGAAVWSPENLKNSFSIFKNQNIGALTPLPQIDDLALFFKKKMAGY